jgi:hypothetical protein
LAVSPAKKDEKEGTQQAVLFTVKSKAFSPPPAELLARRFMAWMVRARRSLRPMHHDAGKWFTWCQHVNANGEHAVA